MIQSKMGLRENRKRRQRHSRSIKPCISMQSRRTYGIHAKASRELTFVELSLRKPPLELNMLFGQYPVCKHRLFAHVAAKKV